MKELDLTKIENEQIQDLFRLFFGVIQHSLAIKDKNRSRFSQFTSDRNLRIIEKNKEIIQFEHFDSFIKNLQALEKNEDYRETTDWKVLKFLSPELTEHAQVKLALEYLNQSEFLGENNFSIIKVASIIYSLSQSKPLDAADMLAFLNHYTLLNEESLGKIRSNRNLDIKLFTSVIQKLSLNGGTDHLLTQANLDKLLEDDKLNLEFLAKFIYAEDESKPLTQEKFDLAINLKNLLTLENIEKIEKAEFDPKKLSDVLSSLDKADILSQDNFDQLMGLNKDDFEKIVPVLVTMHKTNILNQDNFLKFLDTFLATCIYDERADVVDSVNGQQSSKVSLTDKFCMMLKESWLGRNAQVIFNKIIAAFNKITKRYETQDASVTSDETATAGRNPNAFFASSCSRSENVTDPQESRANISNTCGVK